MRQIEAKDTEYEKIVKMNEILLHKESIYMNSIEEKLHNSIL